MEVIRSRCRAIRCYPIKIANSCSELVSLLAFQEQLRNSFASTFVFGSDDGFILLLVLVLVVDRAETVLWVASFVISFCVLRLDFPYTLLLQGERFPAITCGVRKFNIL
jgi:hypothetical protein